MKTLKCQSGQELQEIKQILPCGSEKLTKWFWENYMVLNQGKCHLCLRRNTENETFVSKISEEQKMFGIVIDNELTMLIINAKKRR